MMSRPFLLFEKRTNVLFYIVSTFSIGSVCDVTGNLFVHINQAMNNIIPIHAVGAASVPPIAILKPGSKNKIGKPAIAFTDPCAKAATHGLFVLIYIHEIMEPSNTQNTIIINIPRIGYPG